MTDIEVDPERFGAQADALLTGSQQVSMAGDEVTAATGAAASHCGSIDDGGLRQALHDFGSAWSFDLSGVGNDLHGTGSVMRTLASLYGQTDTKAQQALADGG